MTTSFKGPLTHSKPTSPATYAYHEGSGLMPSTEYSVFFDDFFAVPASNAIPGATTIIDTGATLTAAATDAISYHGAVAIASDGTSEGVANYWPKGIQLGLGKRFFMEVRAYTVDADDTDLQFGLTIANATTNPEDLYTTAATDLIAFGVLDGDATPALLCDKNNAGTTVDQPSGTAYDLSDATWHVLGIEVGGKAADSTMWCKAYVDGKLAVTWDTETSIPDDCALAPFIAARTGGDAGHVIYFDYVRWALER